MAHQPNHVGVLARGRGSSPVAGVRPAAGALEPKAHEAAIAAKGIATNAAATQENRGWCASIVAAGGKRKNRASGVPTIRAPNSGIPNTAARIATPLLLPMLMPLRTRFHRQINPI